jgi:hypothetical protein
MIAFLTLQKDDIISPVMDREQDTYWQEIIDLFASVVNCAVLPHLFIVNGYVLAFDKIG